MTRASSQLRSVPAALPQPPVHLSDEAASWGRPHTRDSAERLSDAPRVHAGSHDAAHRPRGCLLTRGARNRIIAGLAAATVVVEARERSGALITADLALEEGREVFAVPGEITSALSAGTNALLRIGATALTSATDVLESFGIAPRVPEPVSLSDQAERVLARLRDEPATADELSRALSLDPSELASALAELELAGLADEGSGLYRAATTS